VGNRQQGNRRRQEEWLWPGPEDQPQLVTEGWAEGRPRNGGGLQVIPLEVIPLQVVPLQRHSEGSVNSPSSLGRWSQDRGWRSEPAKQPSQQLSLERRQPHSLW
jgi:hypothetical protein